jgi:hypothetical protein
MKFDRIIWGVLLLFIGGVLLLENFNVINFYWGYLWDFWPMILIILGVNFIFSKNKQTGGIISLVLLLFSLLFLFVRGQQEPNVANWQSEIIEFDEEEEGTNNSNNVLSEPFLNTDSTKKTVLNLFGGGVSFNIAESTDDLFSAAVANQKQKFFLSKVAGDSLNTLTFKMKDKTSNWTGDDDVDFKMNTHPIWEINLKLGAGEVNFDLTKHKIRTFNFNGGAAALEISIGSELPITDINVKTGMADVKIAIPTTSGCRIKTKTGLSNKDFEGFEKKANGFYETSNFSSSANKIFINFDGGLSNFEVNRN